MGQTKKDIKRQLRKNKTALRCLGKLLRMSYGSCYVCIQDMVQEAKNNITQLRYALSRIEDYA